MQGSHEDFHWLSKPNPHTERRGEILRKYPEIKKLYGVDAIFKWQVSFLVGFQILTIPMIANLPWIHLLALAYFFGGIINHMLALAQHEIAHNAAFGHSRPLANRWFGILTNLPLGIPISISFKKYHILHHQFLSIDGYDPDLPTATEAALFQTTMGKLLWVVLQPFFYILRPLVAVQALKIQKLEICNFVIQFLFNSCVVCFYGWKPLVYLISGSLVTMGLHPFGGHLIAEHYMFSKGFETYSYYGVLNKLTFNVGYHNEHHDFPHVPGSKLPELRDIAKEFYDPLPCHSSWCRVLLDFIFDPNVNLYSRIKRRGN